MATESFEISVLTAEYVSGKSPEEIIEEVYSRIETVNDPGIFLHLRDKVEVVAEAANLGEYDPERPLWGIPFVIKDNIDLGGAPTTAACPDFTYIAEKDAFVVAQLRAAGALLIGKTNLDQFATGLVGVRSPYPIPKNAVDPDIVPGGSSSGSGVAVGHGIVSFSLGTDTAGSGRVPAALNNIVGLKPSLGALSASGVVPACRTLDTISIFALTVPDAFKVFRAAAKFDKADAYSRRFDFLPLTASQPGLIVAVPDANSLEFFGDDIQAASFAASLDEMRNLGCTVTEIDFTPFFEVAKMLYEGAWVAERMSVIDGLMKETPEAVHPVTRKVVGMADGLTAVDAFRGIYRLAELTRAAEPALAAVDLLCVPTIPTFYTVRDLDADPIGPNSRFGTYTNFVNLMDMCGIAVPTRPRSDGRPGSVTLLAKSGEDALIAGLAAQLHMVCNPEMGATRMHAANHDLPNQYEPTDGEMEIAVVGAHMSGLPLNHELTNRGARLLNATTTSPDYRLYALPGGPPARPGLICDNENGAKIDIEIWAMPKSEIGQFMSGIPAPLSIGTLKAADGHLVKGFLVEHMAIAASEDVTDYGGWRAYLESVA